MNTQYWGKNAWVFLHATTYAYPDKPNKKQRKAMANLFNGLCYILPCQKCQEHWQQNIKKSPVEPHLRSRDSLTRWLIDMHNEVNKQTGKPVVSPDEVSQQYAAVQPCDCQMGIDHSQQCEQAGSAAVLKYWLIISLLLVIIAALLYYIFVCRKM